jgi:multiple sugar transport system permease protein
MTLVLLWPLGYAAYLSTFDYYLGSREMRFVGLANYAQLLSETPLAFALDHGRYRPGIRRRQFALGLFSRSSLQAHVQRTRIHDPPFLPHIITPVVATLFEMDSDIELGPD